MSLSRGAGAADVGHSMPRLSQDPASLAEFFGLLVECPLLGGNPKDCQLHHVRTLQLQHRYEWAKGLEATEAWHIRAKCSQCMSGLLQAGGVDLQRGCRHATGGGGTPVHPPAHGAGDASWSGR